MARTLLRTTFYLMVMTTAVSFYLGGEELPLITAIEMGNVAETAKLLKNSPLTTEELKYEALEAAQKKVDFYRAQVVQAGSSSDALTSLAGVGVSVFGISVAVGGVLCIPRLILKALTTDDETITESEHPAHGYSGAQLLLGGLITAFGVRTWQKATTSLKEASKAPYLLARARKIYALVEEVCTSVTA